MEYVKSDAGTLAMQEAIGLFVLCLGLGPFFPSGRGSRAMYGLTMVIVLY